MPHPATPTAADAPAARPAPRTIEQLLGEQTLEYLERGDPESPALKNLAGLYFRARQLALAERKLRMQLERHRLNMTALQEKLGLASGAGRELSEEESRAILDKLDEILGLKHSPPRATNT